jgi:hypothetical protein
MHDTNENIPCTQGIMMISIIMIIITGATALLLIFASYQKHFRSFVRFNFLTAASVCSLVEVDRRLGGSYCFHHQGGIL